MQDLREFVGPTDLSTPRGYSYQPVQVFSLIDVIWVGDCIGIVSCLCCVAKLEGDAM